MYKADDKLRLKENLSNEIEVQNIVYKNINSKYKIVLLVGPLEDQFEQKIV